MNAPHPLARRGFLGACGAAAATLAQPAFAQGRGPVRLVQGYAAGGLIDVGARAIAEAVSSVLGETVIVDARPSANGSIAAAYVAGSKPDGNTWLLTGLPHITNVATGPPARSYRWPPWTKHASSRWPTCPRSLKPASRMRS